MEVSFAERLKAGYRATDEEIPEIRQVIARTLEERATLQARADRFYTLINDLHSQMQTVDDRVNNYRALICAILRLPVEVLQRIFCWCLPRRNSIMSSHEAPLLLTRVCGEWREIALSTPRLWSSMHVHAPSLANYHIGSERRESIKATYAEAIASWLSRSGDLPLSISYVDDDPGFNYWPGVPDTDLGTEKSDFLDILLRFSHRWSQINLKILHRYLEHFSTLTENNFPILESFEIEILHPADQAALSHLSFLRAPSVRKVCLWNLIFLQTPSSVPLQWENLTTFSLTSMFYHDTHLDANDALTILRRCSNLIVCALTIIVNQEIFPQEPIVILPALRELRLSLLLNTFPDHTDFFKAFDLPQLRHLEVSKAHVCNELPFMPLLYRKHEIDTLAFDVQESQLDNVLECLSYTPSLTRLFLNSAFISLPWSGDAKFLIMHTVGLALLSHLNPRTATTILCPSLREIVIRFPLHSDVTDDHLLDFILSRTSLAPEGVSQLTHASFSLRCQAQRDLRKDLQHVIAQGFQLTLRYDNLQPYWNTPIPFIPGKDKDMSKSYGGWIPRFPTV